MVARRARICRARLVLTQKKTAPIGGRPCASTCRCGLPSGGLGSGVGASGDLFARSAVPFPARPASIFSFTGTARWRPILRIPGENQYLLGRYEEPKKSPSVATVRSSAEWNKPKTSSPASTPFCETAHPLPASCSRGQVQRTTPSIRL
jgi:hypothetical protein